MARQIGNEDELLAALQRLLGVQASLLDFAGLSGAWGVRRVVDGVVCWADGRPPQLLFLHGVAVRSCSCCRRPPHPSCHPAERSSFAPGTPLRSCATVPEQLRIVQSTDVLVGMHGAALAHALLMPPHAALVELWPQVGGWCMAARQLGCWWGCAATPTSCDRSGGMQAALCWRGPVGVAPSTTPPPAFPQP